MDVAGQEKVEPRRSLDGLGMYLVRQAWQQPEIADIPAAVQAELARTGALERVNPSDEIAITAGSRGIAAMPQVLRAAIAAVRERGGMPFVFPAMGSHGGGTAAGQRALLAGLGVDEHTMGAPIRASMEVVQIGETADGLPVYLDALASRARGIIVVNRVKKHTNFDGPVESGLCKMAVIGMGKHVQAVKVHERGNAGFSRSVQEAADIVFTRARVLAGLALVENAGGGVAELVGLRANEILAREPALLQQAEELSAKIPFPQMDMAIVERLGKEISGTGMDCYVIGRKRIVGEAEWPEAPRIGSLVVLDLTEASHGNALGIGLADFTTRRLVDRIDWPTLRANILTSGNLERGKLPLVFDSAREAIEAAAFRERATPEASMRLVCLRDTLHLRHLLVSEALLRSVRARTDLEIVGGPLRLAYDAEGQWVSPFPSGG